LCRERAKIVAKGPRKAVVNMNLLPHAYIALIQHKENLKCVKQARLKEYSHEYTSQEEKELSNE